MKVSADKLKYLCREKQLSLNQMLKEAGVSRNAYYSLLRKNSVLPRSIHAIAQKLCVPPSELLTEESTQLAKAEQILKQVRTITQHYQKADPDNIRHTLVLLQDKPIDRLRRALLRGQKFNFYGKRSAVSQGVEKTER
jgi:transcriptional regulator with XRE-family HTH domain